MCLVLSMFPPYGSNSCDGGGGGGGGGEGFLFSS